MDREAVVLLAEGDLGGQEDRLLELDVDLEGVGEAQGSEGGRKVLIAMAGPLSHLLLASALWAAWNALPLDNEPLRVAAGLPALSNFVAGVVNLLPVSVLDGGRAARALTAVFVRVGPTAIS